MIHKKVESIEIGIGHPDDSEILRTLESICGEYPSKYWRDLEDAPVSERYPAAFVTAIMAGWRRCASGDCEAPVAGPDWL